MAIELRILTGARAGQTEWFDKEVIAIGRHPASDFLLDVKKDLDVSRRHGEIRQVGAGYRLYERTARTERSSTTNRSRLVEIAISAVATRSGSARRVQQ